MNQKPKSLNDLMEQARRDNEILNNIYMSEEKNKELYKEEIPDPDEYYYTDAYHFLREESYTINGDPVSKHLGDKDGQK